MEAEEPSGPGGLEAFGERPRAGAQAGSASSPQRASPSPSAAAPDPPGGPRAGLWRTGRAALLCEVLARRPPSARPRRDHTATTPQRPPPRGLGALLDGLPGCPLPLPTAPPPPRPPRPPQRRGRARALLPVGLRACAAAAPARPDVRSGLGAEWPGWGDAGEAPLVRPKGLRLRPERVASASSPGARSATPVSLTPCRGAAAGWPARAAGPGHSRPPSCSARVCCAGKAPPPPRSPSRASRLAGGHHVARISWAGCAAGPRGPPAAA